MSATILQLVSREWKDLDLDQKAFYQGKSEEDKKIKKAQLKAVICKSCLDKSHVSFVSAKAKTSKKIRLNNNQVVEAESTGMDENSYSQVFEPSYQLNDSFEAQLNDLSDEIGFQIREQSMFNPQASPQYLMQTTPAKELSDFNFSFIEQTSTTEREFYMPAPPLLQPLGWESLSFSSLVEPSNEVGLFQETQTLDMPESQNHGTNMTSIFQPSAYDKLFEDILDFGQDEKAMDFYCGTSTKHRKA